MQGETNIKNVTLYTRCRLNRCRYNRVRLMWKNEKAMRDITKHGMITGIMFSGRDE